jgi:hypothetical protein
MTRSLALSPAAETAASEAPMNPLLEISLLFPVLSVMRNSFLKRLDPVNGS